MSLILPPLHRLLRFVSPEPNTGCWLWTGTLNTYGYAMFSMRIDGRKRYFLGHRAMFQWHRGCDLSTEQVLLHKCDVRPCVNPDHLRLGTHADNVADCIKKGRRRYHTGETPSLRTTHCSSCGREKSGDNLYHPPGARWGVCNNCRLRHNRNSEAKRKGVRQRPHRVSK